MHTVSLKPIVLIVVSMLLIAACSDVPTSPHDEV